MKANRLIQPSILVIAALATSSAFAATTLNPGAQFNFNAPANWTNGAPNSSNPGTISANYSVMGTVFSPANTTVTQTAGTGTGTFFNYTATTFTFNLQGGSINLSGQFLANGSTINVSGGSISTTYFQPVNAGILNLSGGTHTVSSSNIFFNTGGATGQLNLTGGTINAAAATSMFSSTTVTPTIGIGDAVINASLVTAFGGGGANMDFLTGWTGSLNFSAATDWSAALISSGATLDGIDIDGTNIDNFLISGGSISLIPEPSAALLGGLGVLGLLMRRRRSA